MTDLSDHSQQIEQLANDLGVEDRTQRLTEILVGTSEIRRAAPGRSTHLVIAASTYLAVREHEESITMLEIADAGDVDKWNLYRTARQMEETLGIEFSVSKPANYIERIIEDLNEAFDSNLSKDLVEETERLIYDNTGTGAVAGRDPIAVAAAAVYLTASHKRITQGEVAAVADVSERTIRSICSDIKVNSANSSKR